MNQGELKETIASELFSANYFEEMFETAIESQRQVELHSNILKNFFKVLNLEAIKELVRNDKIATFLDVLMKFLKNESVSKKDKKAFLNGCENMLFLQALMLGKNDYAAYLNEYRLEKSIQPNKNFLLNRVKAGQYGVVEKLLEYSEDVNFDSSKVLKLLFIHLCRDYDLFKRIIDKHGLDINAYGDLGLDVPFEGSFVHAIALMHDMEASKFFFDFVKDYGSKINFDVQFKDLRRNSSINLLDLIINNDKLDPKNKLARLTLLLNYGSMNESHINHLCKMMMSEDVASLFYSHPIYEALFSHENFNTSSFDREGLLLNVLKMDKSETMNEVREKSNGRVNPISVILEKFFRLSSPLQTQTTHPLLFWIQENKDNKDFSAQTLATLAKYYKPELNDIGLLEMKMPQEMEEILKDAGLYVPEKKGFLSKIFSSKEESSKIDISKKDQSLNNKKKEVVEEVKPQVKSVEKQKIVPQFNEKLISLIKDPEIKKYIDNIKLNVEQFNSLDIDSKDEVIYMNIQLPKFLQTTIENYAKFLKDNPADAKRNILIQLKLLNKKSFETISRNLVSE